MAPGLLCTCEALPYDGVMKDHSTAPVWVATGETGAPAAVLAPETYGAKAHWLARAAALGLPVPPAVVLAPDAVGEAEALAGALAMLEAETGLALDCPERPLLVALRPSAPGAAGGVAPAILNIGVTEATLPALETAHGARLARDLYRRLIHGFGASVLGLESEDFDYALHDALKEVGAESETELSEADLKRLAASCLRLIAEEGMAFPQSGREQLAAGATALRAAWEGPRARMRRLAKGEDEDAAMALILQQMALGLGPEPSGAGIAALRHEESGARGLIGRYLPQAQGEEALMGMRTPVLLTAAERQRRGLSEPSLEERAPEPAAALAAMQEALEQGLGDAFETEFTLEGGRLWLLELRPARRSPRAAVRIAVELAEAGAITKPDAVLRIGAPLIDDHLHPSIDPTARRDPIGRGLPASPGAASGPLVFSPDAAEAAAAEGTPAILALIETGPEDIRGMHAAAGVLTVRGGMTSHAAVVARGLGRPCVVGAKDLVLDRAAGVLKARDGRRFHAGDPVTVEGAEGQVLAGAVRTVAPEITGAFATLMGWADELRRLGVRANGDTKADAALAKRFNAAGIGLCRTEHMFFDRGRISSMREMILAETEEERRAALAALQPMQREDFIDLFMEMAGLPVVIRLLDPPLHEFLPHGAEEMAEIAVHLGVPVEKIAARAADLAEFNPMLGKRGCRIGIAFPEIYEMQVRAILEAACDAARATGAPVRPEIMIPLISAVDELNLIRANIDAVAATLRAERGEMVDYLVGVMIETPRACLRAGDIAASADFLSFGTNDLTQMLYGLSRDDAGRFIPDYVEKGVFAHDPFHRIDEAGVGEIIEIAIARARAVKPDISIGLCGEHGADPASVDFCERAGFDYVSCSPYRVPIARIAAAQAAVRHGTGGQRSDG